MQNTTKPKDFQILSISRTDLDTLGYNTGKIDDATMERIAHDLGEECFEQMFSQSLPEVAERLGIQKEEEGETIDSPLDVAHLEEIARHDADVYNWGWYSSDIRIESKTNKGNLITVIGKSRKVTHRWVRK